MNDSGFGDLQEKGFSQHNAYSLSKLAMMMLTVGQAERLSGRLPTVNCLDPGTVNTKMLIAGALCSAKFARSEHRAARHSKVFLHAFPCLTLKRMSCLAI